MELGRGLWSHDHGYLSKMATVKLLSENALLAVLVFFLHVSAGIEYSGRQGRTVVCRGPPRTTVINGKSEII